MDAAPWYRQFWPWFLIGVLGYSVLTSAITIVLATQTPADLVVDDYYKQGLTINRDLDRQRRAEALGIGGRFALDREAGLVRLELNNAGPGVDVLTLRLVHPTLARYDREIELLRDMTGAYTGQLGALHDSRWRIVVAPPDDTWRLTGRLRLPGRSGTELVPG